ncbi:hypothetical protein F5Y16DRAFT_417132 [Xylariaceae sp. FL0255]|nr:hypothetical protein F5Y16DRAFT_417132 [Xylariaceae sp. FL0255]
MGMSMQDPSFLPVNKRMAQAFWYFIAAGAGAAVLVRLVNYADSYTRIRRSKTSSVEFPTKPANRFFQTWATLTAIGRELSYPQLYISQRYLSWMTPPPAGRILVLLGYWSFVIYIMCKDAILFDYNFWERIGYRNAWVTVTQVPLLYLLAAKHVNVFGLIAGMGYERLNWLHRWVARTMFVIATVHGFHFWSEWVHFGTLEMELQMMSTIVPFGLAAWGILFWMAITSFKPFRSMAYELFVIQHVLSAIALLYVVYRHVPAYAQYNVWWATGSLVLDRVCRLASLVWVNIIQPNKQQRRSCCGGGKKLRFGHETRLTAVGDSLTVVTIRNVHFKWTAGQHVYLWIPCIGVLETHPYTIATAHPLPGTCTCDSIQLIIRSHSGFSKRINESAQRMSTDQRVRSFVVGPYGCPPQWAQFETLVLISASTGASFTLPILESLLDSHSRGTTQCTKRVDFLLTARQGKEIGFYHQRLHEALGKAEAVGIEMRVRIAVTGVEQLEGLRPFHNQQIDEKKADEKEPTQIRERPDSHSSSSGSRDSRMLHSNGRADVSEFIRLAVEATGGETGVVCCGGAALVARVRTSVAKLSDERAVHKGTGAQGIHLHAEEYCF